MSLDRDYRRTPSGWSCGFDGRIGGGKNREKILEIMKDPRVGAFGVIALIAAVLLKAGLIFQLLENNDFIPLIITPAVSRWIILPLILFFPSSRTEGLGAFLKEHARWREAVAGGIITFIPVFFLAGIPGVLVGVIVLGLTAAAGFFIRRKIGGLTGDVLGAFIEWGEILILLLWNGAGLWYE